jgi:predicted membrane protein
MHVIFGVIAVVFLILGIVGIIGGFSLVFWPLSALFIWLAIRAYPRDRKGPKAGPPIRQP